MQVKLDHKGMSLIELIISMTIAVIVVVMIITFISGASRAFRRTNDEVNLQFEAQTAGNQLVKLIMEAKKVSDTITVTAEEDYRYVIESLNLAEYSDYVIIFRKDLNKVYLVEMAEDQTPDSIEFDEESFDKEYLLAEYITDFRIQPITVTNPAICMVNIEIKLGLGDDTFEIEKKVKLRNYKST